MILKYIYIQNLPVKKRITRNKTYQKDAITKRVTNNPAYNSRI